MPSRNPWESTYPLNNKIIKKEIVTKWYVVFNHLIGVRGSRVILGFDGKAVTVPINEVHTEYKKECNKIQNVDWDVIESTFYFYDNDNPSQEYLSTWKEALQYLVKELP